jgi:hypothetical protein
MGSLNWFSRKFHRHFPRQRVFMDFGLETNRFSNTFSRVDAESVAIETISA